MALTSNFFAKVCIILLINTSLIQCHLLENYFDIDEQTSDFINYFIFTVTDDFKSVHENLNELDFKKAFETIWINMVYIGSGNRWHASAHTIKVINVLSGHVNTALPFHWFLAKGQLQNLFKSTFVLPFFDTSNHHQLEHIEAATLWYFANHTMNDNVGKFDDVVSVMINSENPANSVKEKLSKHALKTVSEFIFEAGLRRMKSNFGVELKLGTEKIDRPAFTMIDDDVYLYEFGTTVYSRNEDDGSFIMLPFDKIDFKIDMSDLIVKKRLINDATYFLESKLSSFESVWTLKVISKIEQELRLFFDWFLLQDEQKNNSDDYLSTWLKKLYKVVNKAKLGLASDADAKLVELRINMFQAAFEHYLFTQLIKNNKDAMYRENDKPRNGVIILEMPKTFPLKNTSKYTCNQYDSENQFCLKDPFDDEFEIEDDDRFHTCPFCRSVHLTKKEFDEHTKQPGHKILSAVQK